MKRFALLCLICLCVFMTGCSKGNTQYSGNTYELEIPLYDTTYATLTLPTECYLTETDGCTFWKFIDGTTVYRMLNSSKGTSKYDSENDCYYSDNAVSKELENNTSIVISANKRNQKMLRDLAGKITTDSRTITPYKEQKSSVLPSYDEDAPMVFTDANLYMPEGAKETTFDGSSAQIYSNGKTFCESWVMLRRFEDLKPTLLNYVTCNSNTKIQLWYEDDGIFYAESDNYVVGCKAITMNQWVCYIASYDMKDFVLKGIDKIHLAE